MLSRLNEETSNTMTSNDVKKLIKERGYWEIVITPRTFNPKTIPDRSACKEIVSKNSVQLRGWDYPHIPKNDQEHQRMYFGKDHCEAFIDWGNHKEVFRLYQSGQFVHYLALFEDWLAEDMIGKMFGSSGGRWDAKPREILSVIGVVYTITEIYEFARRIAASSDIYDSGLRIEIKFNGAKGRRLEVLDPMRIGLFGSYTSELDIIEIPIIELNKEDILNSSKELALDAIKYLFESFNWDNIPLNVLQQDQQNLIERRF